MRSIFRSLVALALIGIVGQLALIGIAGRADAQAILGSASNLQSALSTTVATVKGSQGKVTTVSCYNPDAAVSYVQIFDTAGTVTLGTTVPKISLGLAATSAFAFPVNTAFLNAIKVAATTTPTGSTAPTTALTCNFGFY